MCEAPYQCKFCGMPSWVDPSDQEAPPDYCHESDHGSPCEHDWCYCGEDPVLEVPEFQCSLCGEVSTCQ